MNTAVNSCAGKVALLLVAAMALSGCEQRPRMKPEEQVRIKALCGAAGMGVLTLHDVHPIVSMQCDPRKNANQEWIGAYK